MENECESTFRGEYMIFIKTKKYKIKTIHLSDKIPVLKDDSWYYLLKHWSQCCIAFQTLERDDFSSTHFWRLSPSVRSHNS